MPYEHLLEGWVESCLSDIKKSLAPKLVKRLERHLEARGKLKKPLYNFTRAAQPVVHLPIWVAESLRSLGIPTQDIHVQRAVASAVCGYLMAQLQDEIIDGADSQDPDTMLLAQALFLQHEELLTPAMALSPLYRARWRHLWRDYTNALSLERHLSRGAGVRELEDFHRILGRSRPMALPAGSLLAISGRDDLLADFEAIISLTTRAAQLVDDTADALIDLKEGNRTWVVCAYGGLDGSQALIQSLYIQEGFNDVLNSAKQDMQSALSIAQAKGLRPLAKALGSQVILIDVVRTEVLHSIFDPSVKYDSSTPDTQESKGPARPTNHQVMSHT